MADYPHLSNWQGWLAKQKYAHLDPFDRPIPAPVAGIFDNTSGDLRTICFNPAWSPILTGALSRLTVTELYLSNGEQSVQDVLKLMNLVAGIGDNPCLPQSVDAMSCAYYPSWYAGIEYIPYNPFAGGDLPANYDIAPFFRFAQIDTWFPDWLDDIFQDVIENTTGYLENDVFVSFFSLPTYQNPFDGLDYPTIKLTVQGSGMLRLKFLLVPFGGRALISFDPVGVFDILQAVWSSEDRIIELNRDILALVPETDLDAIEEIVLDEDTTHEIYITFLPTINDEAPIFQYGGGFRGYELCGNLTVISPVTGEPIDFNNPSESMQEGMIMATYEDFLDALDAHEIRKASRYLLALEENLDTDVIVSASGSSSGKNVELDDSGGKLIQFIPSTIEEQRNGAVYRQAQGIADLLSEATALQIALFTKDQITNISTLVINPTNLITWALVISDYFDGAGAIVIDVDALASYLYCHNVGVAIVKYATEDTGSGLRHTQIETDYLVRFIAEIPQSTFSDWSKEGKSSPRTEYVTYDCYLQPVVSGSVDFSDYVTFYNQNFAQIFPNTLGNRNWRLELSGKFVDANGDEYDGVYHKTAGDVFTVNVVELIDIGVSLYSASNTPPYSNGYILEYSTGGAPDALKLPQAFTPVSGVLTLNLYDLGAN